jgi:outer membrane protein TolC
LLPRSTGKSFLDESSEKIGGIYQMRLAFTLVLMLLLKVNIHAVEPPKQNTDQPAAVDLEHLTLDDAITSALEHSPQIKAAEITVALAEIDLKQTQWFNWFVPSLSLHQGYNPALAESAMGLGVNFDLNQILGGGLRQSKKATLKLFDAEIYLTTVKQTVIAYVTKSYYDYVIAQENRQILRKQLENSVKLQELLKLKFESGQATINQLLSLSESIATTKVSILKAEAELKLTFLKLKQEIGYTDE